MSAGNGTPRSPLLAVNNIEVIYDHVILVLKGVSLEVPEGGIVALLGANGAGKSTTLKAISGLLRTERGDVTKGTIEFQGAAIHRHPPDEVVRRGIVQVMEGRHVFGHLTVEENLLTGAYTRRNGAEMRQDLERVYAYFPRLRERRGHHRRQRGHQGVLPRPLRRRPAQELPRRQALPPPQALAGLMATHRCLSSPRRRGSSGVAVNDTRFPPARERQTEFESCRAIRKFP